MRIAVIAGNLRVAGGASVGRNIVSTLPTVAPMHDYLFFVPGGVGYATFPDKSNVSVIETDAISTPSVAVDILRRIPVALRAFEPDLVWTLGNLPLRHTPCRQALLVHNPHLFYANSHFIRESWRYKQKNRAMAAYVRRSLRFVDIVFCQTTIAAHRFEREYRHSNVAVMPNAISGVIDLAAQATRAPSIVRRRSDSFRLIALTKYYAHKNLELIVDAYSRFGNTLLRGTVCFLTIDRTQHPRAHRLLQRIERETPTQIVNLGPLRQEDVGACFQSMDALLHPSSLESFSASYLEAMAFGTPILASDFDFSREICGGAAIYFDPVDPANLANAIRTLLDNVELRDRLSEEGRRRLAAMSMDWPTVVKSALGELGVPHL